MDSPRILTDLTTEALERGLDGAHRRRRVVVENLANIETPGYRARSVHFEDQLAEAINARHDQRASGERPSLQCRPTVGFRNTPARGDGNTVDIEIETVELAKTSLHYKYRSRLLRKKLQMLHRAINGGQTA